MTKLIKYKEKKVSPFREKLNEVVSDCYLFIQQDKMPKLLRPIYVRIPSTCVISGETIAAGEFAFPCYSNPVRLSPNGSERCHVHYAKGKGKGLFPEGVVVARVPLAEEVYKLKTVRQAKEIEKKSLEKGTTKLLKYNSNARG